MTSRKREREIECRKGGKKKWLTRKKKVGGRIKDMEKEGKKR